MRLNVEWLMDQGEDGGLLHWIDAAFLLEHPGRVGVAVSGGGDSMALLHLTHRWSQEAGVPIEAVTVNHGLRAEADIEAALVADFCAARDIPHTVLDWDGTAAKGNLMAAARDARYRLIADWAEAQNIGGVLVGHTADDVAETFLMRLARRSGVDGLALMETRFDRHGVAWARPLWQQRRADLRTYLEKHGVAWAEDPTNEDPAYGRTRARAALAAMEDLGIDVDTLKDVSLNLYSARMALEHYTAQAARKFCETKGGDVLIVLDPRRGPLPEEIKRRLLAAAIRWVGRSEHGPRGAGLMAMEQDLAMRGSQTIAGCLVSEEDGRLKLRISRELNQVRDLKAPTTAGWDGRWMMDGPHAPDLHIGALGEGIRECDLWRQAGLPRATLMASPAIWRGSRLIAAPLALHNTDWTARIVTPFADSLVSH